MPPVLDVTRPVVKSYNQILKREVLKLKEKEESLKEKLHWLEFLKELLSEDGKKLNPELEFDETHLAPSYTQYLQKALLKCQEH